MKFLIFQVICVFCFSLHICASNEDYLGRLNLGYGAQRLKKQLQLSTNADCGTSQEYYFKGAVIDNFAPIESQHTWAGEGQRYWLNKEFWGGSGYPIFVFIGGEGQESCTRLSSRMFIYELAQKHNALMVDIEHRFYGQSYPTEGMSTKELGYLTADQALADLARAITFIKKDLQTEKSKVITVGGSYPGNLAAWFRLKYPSVTKASIASSAPVTAKTNFFEYMEVVARSLVYFSGQACYDAFEKAANEVARLAAQGVGSAGMQQLEKDFKTCAPIGNKLDLAVMMSDLMGNIQGTIQYNNEHSGVLNVTDICSTMVATTDSYKQFVELSAQYLASYGQACEDASWKDTVEYLSATQKDPTNNARPWTYQTCNEFGYYQTADSKAQPFHAWAPLNLDFSREICKASFGGWKSDPAVEWINTNYGDVRIAGTNILFPSGTIDPWHALGVTNATTGSLPEATEEPLYIEGTAHCHDLYAPANSDPASLTFAREVVAAHVDKWLA